MLLSDLAAGIRRMDRTRSPADELGAQGTMGVPRRLPPHHRDVLVVVALFRLRYWEAAVICNCPIGTIKSRFNRARASFNAQIGTLSSIRTISHSIISAPRHVQEASRGPARPIANGDYQHTGDKSQLAGLGRDPTRSLLAKDVGEAFTWDQKLRPQSVFDISQNRPGDHSPASTCSNIWLPKPFREGVTTGGPFLSLHTSFSRRK